MSGETLTPRVLQVVGHAMAVADQYGHDYIGTEHTLLGLLADDDGIAGKVLRNRGVSDDAAIRLRAIIESEGYQSSSD
jgi:ATP-dependent Clp protease ATP-binding subunit ClpC